MPQTGHGATPHAAQTISPQPAHCRMQLSQVICPLRSTATALVSSPQAWQAGAQRPNSGCAPRAPSPSLAVAQRHFGYGNGQIEDGVAEQRHFHAQAMVLHLLGDLAPDRPQRRRFSPVIVAVVDFFDLAVRNRSSAGSACGRAAAARRPRASRSESQRDRWRSCAPPLPGAKCVIGGKASPPLGVRRMLAAYRPRHWRARCVRKERIRSSAPARVRLRQPDAAHRPRPARRYTTPRACRRTISDAPVEDKQRRTCSLMRRLAMLALSGRGSQQFLAAPWRLGRSSSVAAAPVQIGEHTVEPVRLPCATRS